MSNMNLKHNLKTRFSPSGMVNNKFLKQEGKSIESI